MLCSTDSILADELDLERGAASCGRETRPARRHGGHLDAVRRSAASGGPRFPSVLGDTDRRWHAPRTMSGVVLSPLVVATQRSAVTHVFSFCEVP